MTDAKTLGAQATARSCRECGGNLRHADECWTGAVEARLAEAERLLRAVREADVIFAKSDWGISRSIDAFLDAKGAGE